MIEELIYNVVSNTLNSFDIPFCITVNIATYLIIKTLLNNKKKYKLSFWNKRLVLLAVSIITAIVYCLNGSDYKIIFNSFILAPVSWSWIFKPICAKLKIDYNATAITK